jgi:hypothetical protein
LAGEGIASASYDVLLVLHMMAMMRFSQVNNSLKKSLKDNSPKYLKGALVRSCSSLADSLGGLYVDACHPGFRVYFELLFQL